MPTIKDVFARMIFDSRGNPTVECEVTTEDGVFRAAVPSGASTGIHEALELRDGDPAVFMGKGVTKAIHNVKTELRDAVMGMDVTDQAGIDAKMIEVDGTGRLKKRLGANAILGISMAVCRAGAAAKKIALYEHINNLAGNPKILLPVPCCNVLNGGEHAGNRLAPQEFMLMPVGASSFSEAMRMVSETYHHLKSVIQKKYGLSATGVGDEGGFAPNIQKPEEAFELIVGAIAEAGYTGKIKIGIDPAASQFYLKDTNMYDLDFKNPEPHDAAIITGKQLLELYKGFIAKYPIILLEDPFDENDFESFTMITAEIGGPIEIVGDDLLVTNPDRIKKGLEVKACNSLLLKVNQIGSITETIESNNMVRKEGWGVFVSHRSGETEDSFIADLVIGLGTGHIKTGAPCRSERLAKYNQMLRIEERLGDKAIYTGTNLRTPWKI